MAGLKLMTQGGYVPRAAPHLLQDNEAQKAVNTKLYAGDLRSWRMPGSITPNFTLPSGTKSIYKGKANDGAVRWISWTNDVDVVKNPIQDSTNLMSIYYTGDGVPKKTNSTLAGTTNGVSPTNWLNMGVPNPTAKPNVTRVGGGSHPETRIYVYTYISEFGGITEESGPSPVSDEVLCGTGDTVTVDNFAAAPTTNYNITKLRIYRSVTGSSVTTFLFVAEIPIGTTSFSDNVTSAGLGEELPSLTWEPPPSDLTGIIVHPNGFLVGFSGQEICFSEIGAPHAWPTQYRQSLNVDIVGLGVFGTSIAVMTQGYPQIFNGSVPEAMSSEKIPELEPCIAKRSIVSDAQGVMYASPNGICVLAPGAAGLATGNIMLRDDFAKFNPSTLVSAVFAGKYFGFYTDGDEPVKNGGFILDRTLPATPLSLTSLTSDACFVDPETATLYVVNSNKVLEWEGDELNWLPYEWLSKKFIFTKPTNLGALEIDADFGSIAETEAIQQRIDEIIASNQAIFASGASLGASLNSYYLNQRELNGSILQNIPEIVNDRYLLVEVICDGKIVHIGNYVKNGMYRLPSGFKGQIFEIRLGGNIELRYVKMAETVKELASL